MRDQTIIKALSQQEQAHEATQQQHQELRCAIGRFLEMPLLERLGWLCFGSTWLVKRWAKKFHADLPPRG